MEFPALENDKLKKNEEETKADYSFPTPRYERLITCGIMRNFSATNNRMHLPRAGSSVHYL